MMRGVVIDMNDKQLRTLAQPQGLLNGTVAVDFAVVAEKRYDFIARSACRFGCRHLKRVDKAVVLRFLERISGYSRQHVARLAAMIGEAGVDAYGDSEQTTGWYTILEEHLALPFETMALDVVVKVARLDLRGGNEIVAICTRDREQQAVPIPDLPLPRPKPVGAEWIDAYRHWVGG